MQLCARQPATTRAVLAVLLLAGLGLWQAWQCHNGTMTSPVTGLVASASHHDGEPGAGTHQDPLPGSSSGLAGLCITVLAGIAGALMLITAPVRLVALLRRLGTLMVTPVHLAARRPVLTELCISRT